MLSVLGAVFLAVSGCSDLGQPLPPDCGLSSAALDFGETTSGGTVDRSVDLENSGFETLSGTAQVNGAGFTITSGGGAYTLEPGERITIDVRFEPSAIGAYAGTLDGGTECSPVALAGTAADPIPNAQCDASTDSLIYGDVDLGTSATSSFRILNTGAVDFSGTVVSPCGDFAVIAGGGSFTLTPGDSLVVTVRFSPSTEGASSCLISTGVNCPDVTCAGSGVLGTIENVSYATQIQPIFTASCAINGCHVSPAPRGSLNLTASLSYGEIVGVVSFGYSPAIRVVPADPDASVLYNKVSNTGVFNGGMPPGGASLSAFELALIRTWILEGASSTP